METKEWLAVGALVVLALFIGRQSNKWVIGSSATPTPEPVETEQQTPIIQNGQAYYDVHLSLTGTAYNGLSNEFLPLFGFVGTRTAT